MEFSVVIPLYNKVNYIAETLASVVAQEKLPKELIIIDDRSTDGSLERAKAFLETTPKRFEKVDVKIIELEENRGPGYARNLGFSKTTGDIISFLDADDLYHPELLSQVEQLTNQHNIDFLVVGIQLFPSKIEYPKLISFYADLTSITRDGYRLDQPLKTITSPDFVMGTGSNVFAKRQWMESISYVENALFNEANDFWYRVLKNVLANLGNVGLLMGNYIQVREVQGSLSRKKYRSWSEIEIPPIYKRYKKSTYKYDKLLMGVICQRWIKHSFRNLSSSRQKVYFTYRHRSIFFKQLRYYFLRINA
ncbi:glycosyltransferase family 2 protein [Pseudotenacibaculum haliotis]|uniref:Glycosyltransferase family 2 protein n=1 Tax=Pseudotenacibaculum haliotis TaxID=1862138 RepID=A0ABW5LNB0_9FLAO